MILLARDFNLSGPDHFVGMNPPVTHILFKFSSYFLSKICHLPHPSNLSKNRPTPNDRTTVVTIALTIRIMVYPPSPQV